MPPNPLQVRDLSPAEVPVNVGPVVLNTLIGFAVLLILVTLVICVIGYFKRRSPVEVPLRSWDKRDEFPLPETMQSTVDSTNRISLDISDGQLGERKAVQFAVPPDRV